MCLFRFNKIFIFVNFNQKIRDFFDSIVLYSEMNTLLRLMVKFYSRYFTGRLHD
ncbi:hypothetical protein [Klebsiella phage ST846-OXA48phi9.2]|nr:hypothetical protein [Klebsiella phage ST846-OXA48phi9.2]DAL61842.1 MAG TPA_asm: hypothetical protein [Caudoviricetes sp.]DAT66611.1 MAG TPA: hypothetical protein [Caudoviricetes sp.]